MALHLKLCPFKCHCIPDKVSESHPHSGNVIEYLFHALDFIIICLPPFHFVTTFVGVEVIIDDSMSPFSIFLNLVEIILVPFLNTLVMIWSVFSSPLFRYSPQTSQEVEKTTLFNHFKWPINVVKSRFNVNFII